MQVIIDYLTVMEVSQTLNTALTDLDYRIQQKIREGWQPFGGISTYYGDSVHHATQVMVKYAKQSILQTLE